MNDKRGFAFAVVGALLAASGFLILQFVRTSQSTGDSVAAGILVGVMAISLVTVMLIGGYVVAVAYGWDIRARNLRAQGSWDVIASALRSEELISELRRGNPAGARRVIPRGLTIVANSQGIGIWSGRSTLALELWLPWSNIDDIRPAIGRDVLERYRAVGLLVRWGPTMLQLPIPVTGGFPFGVRPANQRVIDELIEQLLRARSRGIAATTRQAAAACHRPYFVDDGDVCG
ncbi:hypothetical protein SAMN05216554_2689 [Herbiconiux ginsengi]|uniref:Uncharacterized protein n=1 Tax=Herbiconiux ginsengi TaxID=381665 RepID=A0A1H3QSU4_9MICO|nr:hypothetical protein SAMN05216554_2689 [Herbiconiux ginsengi]